MNNKIGRRGVVRLLKWQVATMILCIILAFCWSGQLAAYSALLGALVCIIPSQYFAYRVFKHSGARSAKAIVKSLYRGEAIKLLLTIILFTLVFKFISVSAISFFLSFIAIQMLGWLTPVLFVTKTD